MFDFQTSAVVKTRELMAEAQREHLVHLSQRCRTLHRSLLDRIRSLLVAQPVANSTWQDAAPCCTG